MARPSAQVIACLGLLACSSEAQPSLVIDAAVPREAAVQQDARVAPLPVATVRTSLIDHDKWWRLDADQDPFSDRLANVQCGMTAVMAELLGEERAYSVDTGLCNYITAEQPVCRALAKGEIVKVRLWHFELTNAEPAEAHAAVQLGELAILDEHIPIPSPGALIVRQVQLEHDVSADTPVYFHLHNHGANSWALVEVSGGP